ncbi:phage tail protein [Glaesserella australis]|uniref:Phage tail protein n=2 Tax=Pasteurellaceae TaxID=712 RepID=A0A328C2B3_9PAST|nr:phage tail protein [Glaesserella sp. 15-184]RAL18654.1 phage tail protein [Glaesserella australis]
MNPINTPTQRFKDGNPATGEYGTIVTAEFLNNVQDSVINTQQELHSVLTEAGIEANNEQLDQVAKAIKKIAGDATRDNFNELANPDGYKLVGRCKSVAELRTIRPTEHGQRILVDSYYENGTTGGGEFVADLKDMITPDNGGSCIVVDNNAGRWKRVIKNGYVSVTDFGAMGDGSSDDTTSLNAAHRSHNNVYYPQGVYKITNPLLLKSNTNINGAGVGLTIIKHGVSHAFKNSAYKTGGGEKNITIKNISFDAESKFDGGISMVGVSDILIDNCEFGYIKPEGVTVGIGIGGLSNNITVSNCNFDVQDYGIVFDSTSENKVIENIRIRGNKIRTVWGSGISLSRNIKRVVVANNNISVVSPDNTIGIGIKIWQGSSKNVAPEDIIISGNTFLGTQNRQNIQAVSVANWSSNIQVSNNTFREVTYALFNNFSGGAYNIAFSNNLIVDSDNGFYNDNSSDVQPVIVSNIFKNITNYAIRTSLYKGIISLNKINDVGAKAVYLNLPAEEAIISNNNFNSIGEEVIYFSGGGNTNELCSITGNIMSYASQNADNNFPVIKLNNQSHIISGNLIRNDGEVRPSYIIGGDTSQGNRVITNNFMYGARQGYLQYSAESDVYANNIERGGIG